MQSQTSIHQIEAFRRLLKFLPGTEDVKHTVIKGHLLLEEQLKVICSERVRKPEALNLSDPQWGANQIISLTESLCSGEVDDILWICLRKLNKVRNDVAHNLEPKGFEDRVRDLIGSWPSGVSSAETTTDLFIALSSMLVIITSLIRDPNKKVIELVSDQKAL